MTRRSPLLLLALAGLVAFAGACEGRYAADDPNAHPEGAEVLAVVERLFEAMAERDAGLLADVLLPEGQLVVVQEPPDGSVQTSVMSHRDFTALVASAGAPIIERYWDAEVLIHGPLAVVWTPYDLHVGDEFSHCGVNAFTLVRTDEGWRISGGSYTVEPEGCPPSPLGPL